MGVSGIGLGVSPYIPRSFSSTDKNADGALSLDEFSSIGQNLPTGKSGLSKDSIDKLFAAIDTDGDSSISKSEAKSAFDKLSDALKSLMLNVQEQSGAGAIAPPPPPPPPSVDEIFASADADKSGGLSFDEFKADTAKHAPPGAGALDEDVLKQMFTSFDTDGDGSVSAGEMKTAVERGPQAPSQSQTATASTPPNDAASLFMQALSAYTANTGMGDIVNKLVDTLKAA